MLPIIITLVCLLFLGCAIYLMSFLLPSWAAQAKLERQQMAQEVKWTLEELAEMEDEDLEEDEKAA